MKLNKNGFTLIELLAVVTIMGILMLVAIPAIARTIENTRRDTFANTALEYISAIDHAVFTDSIRCAKGVATEKSAISALPEGSYYYYFKSDDNSGKDLMEKGGRSSWGKAEVTGVVVITKGIENDRTSYKYSIKMVDSGGRGIDSSTIESEVTRTKVKTSGATAVAQLTDDEKNYECILDQ